MRPKVYVDADYIAFLEGREEKLRELALKVLRIDEYSQISDIEELQELAREVVDGE